MTSGTKFSTKDVIEFINSVGYNVLDNDIEYKNNYQNINLEDSDGYKYYSNFDRIKINFEMMQIVQFANKEIKRRDVGF